MNRGPTILCIFHVDPVGFLWTRICTVLLSDGEKYFPETTTRLRARVGISWQGGG
jgi:hypothetical protein